MTAASGIAITSSSPTSCTRACGTSSPSEVPELHRRASGWHEQNGEPSEAIRHALAAGDFERAADLVELAIPAMLRSRQEAAVLGWLELLPDEVVRVRPVLSVGFAGALLAGGEFEGVEARLRDAERWLDGTTGIGQGSQAPAAEMVVVDDAEFRRLPAQIELYRAAQALARGDGPGTVRHARRALELSPADDAPRPCFGSGTHGARVLGERGPRGRALGVCRVHGGTAAGRAHRRYLRVRDRAGGYTAYARASRRGHAHLRAGVAACDSSRAGRFCGERQTCTWG